MKPEISEAPRQLSFLHAADVHLDSPLRNLERYEGAPVERIRGATRAALTRLVDLCIEEGAGFLLLAGDLYDGTWRDYSTGLFFAAEMARLGHAGIEVVLVRGNHDAQSQITRSLRLPDNVRELPTDRPGTVVLERHGVAVHGQGFAERDVTVDLAARYPSPLRDLLNVGLLHTALGGREGHATYAPCSVETLVARGYDYWALGHVHAREVVSEAPWIVFPGNLQGRHARETGAKGATLVTVDGGRIARVEHRPVDVARWVSCDVDVSEAGGIADALDLVRDRLVGALADADGRIVCARVRFVGTTRAHAALAADRAKLEAEVRAAAIGVGGADSLWIERVEVATRFAVDREALAARHDALGHVARALAALRDDDEAAESLLAELGELAKRLPPAVAEGEDGLVLDRAFLRNALPAIEELVLSHLAEGPDAT